VRIAYLCTDPGVPVFGRKGASVHVQAVLRALRTAGHEVALVARRFGDDVPTDLADVERHPLPPLAARDVAAREREALDGEAAVTERLAALGPIDLVYERHALWSAAGMETAGALGVPGVLEVNAPLIDEQRAHRALIAADAAAARSEAAFAAATRVVAVSEGVRVYVEGFEGGRGKVVVLPNGVDPSRYGPAPPRERSPFTVGFVGTLKPWHGLGTLAEGFARFHGRYPDAHLLVVGDGPERAALEARLDELGVRAATTLAGARPPDEVPAWLARMDVATAPYPPQADFYFSPLKVFEYLAAGVPLVASRIGQLQDHLVHGSTCLFADPGDPRSLAEALGVLRSDVGLRRSLALAGRALVTRDHSWDQVVRRSLEGLAVPHTLPTAVAGG
jgi:glycosyltransferase involved in cell wall biosynthesis